MHADTEREVIIILRHASRVGCDHAIEPSSRFLEDLCLLDEEKRKTAGLIEKHFGVRVDESALAGMKTVGELIEYVGERE